MSSCTALHISGGRLKIFVFSHDVFRHGPSALATGRFHDAGHESVRMSEVIGMGSSMGLRRAGIDDTSQRHQAQQSTYYLTRWSRSSCRRGRGLVLLRSPSTPASSPACIEEQSQDGADGVLKSDRGRRSITEAVVRGPRSSVCSEKGRICVTWTNRLPANK